MSQVQSLYRQERKIMDKFNFERVLKAMKALEWKWFGEEPCIGQLKGCASTLLTIVQNKVNSQPADDNTQWFSASTGGFKASAKLINGNWRLGLEFVVECQEDFSVGV